MRRKEVESSFYANKFLWFAVLLVVVLSCRTGLASESQNSCSINITIEINQDEKVTDMSDWSFILLSKFEDHKNYYPLDLASSDKQGEVEDKGRLNIDKVENLKEDHYYELYDTSYSGVKNVNIGLLAINDDPETGSVTGFDSKSLTFDCGVIYPEGHGGMSLLQEDEFTVKVEDKNKDTDQPKTWKVSIFTYQSGYNPGTKRTERVITAGGVSLWLGLVTYLLLDQ